MKAFLSRRALVVSAVAVIAVLLVGGVALFLGRGLLLDRLSAAHPPVTPAASPSGSPSPARKIPPATKLGTLSAGLSLTVVATNLVAADSKGAWVSGTGGKKWTAAKVPAGEARMIVDAKDANHWLIGGPSLQQTADGGATWKASPAQPPGGGPFTPLVVSPADKKIWLVIANGYVYVTRDAGVTWKAIKGLPAVSVARIAAMAGGGKFLLGVGGQVFELTGYGNQVTALPSLPSGSVAKLAVIGTNDPPEALAISDGGHPYVFRGGKWSEVADGLSGPIDGVPAGYAWLGDGGMKLRAAAKLKVSHDGGATWRTAIGLPADQTVEAIANLSANGDTVFAYCAAGDLYRSTDGGFNWSLVSTGLRAP